MSKSSTFLFALRILAVLVGITGAVGLGWATGLYSPDAGPVLEQLGYIGLAISGLWCLVAAATSLVLKDPVHPAVFITMDVLVGLYLLIAGVMVLLSPFAKLSWIDCDGSSFTSICKDPAERIAVIWRFVAAAFCFLNVLVHVAAVVVASKACHQRRKGTKGKNDDFELTT